MDDFILNKKFWTKCKICNKSLQNIKKEQKGSNNYFSRVFIKHILNHNISIEEYIENNLKLSRPVCKCGICNKKCTISKKCQADIKYREYMCGRMPGFQEWSEWAKKGRKGIHNPMYGKTPWNKGLNKNTHQSIKKAAEKNTNKKTSLKTKQKQSISAKKRKIHGHTGHKHSQETKNKISLSNVRRLQNKNISFTQTKPHIEFSKILTKLNIIYEEEKIVNYWSFDFYLPKFNTYIEVDGDYWHTNPNKYPQGPITKAQKTNYTRDIKKNNFCKQQNINLIRFWESDILKNKDKIICKLKKLLK